MSKTRTTNVYLISGRTGAGKTTIAKQLASELNAFRISHDEWLCKTYGNLTEQIDFKACCENVNQLIWSNIEQLSKCGVDVILEGWGTRELRDQARETLDSIGVSYQFIYIDCPREMRWERVKSRNESLTKEGVYIDEENFNRMETLREEFDSDEKHIVIQNSSDSPPSSITTSILSRAH